MPLPNPVRQQAARATLADLMTQARSAYAIHYACQSFYDDGAQSASQRIVTLAVRNLASGQVDAFSIARIAEQYRLAPADIAHYWPHLEKALLGDFAEYVRMRRDMRFVHWNMRDDRFGFPALAHRARVLGVIWPEIAERDRIDLSQLLNDIYGDGYMTERAKLEALARVNALPHSDFLRGSDEARAVGEARWGDVHASTLTKARLIGDLAIRAHDRTLVTQAGFVARHGGPVRLMARKLIENPGYSIATFGIGSFVVVFKVYDWLFG